jgi:hypothetical protein
LSVAYRHVWSTKHLCKPFFFILKEGRDGLVGFFYGVPMGPDNPNNSPSRDFTPGQIGQIKGRVVLRNFGDGYDVYNICVAFSGCDKIKNALYLANETLCSSYIVLGADVGLMSQQELHGVRLSMLCSQHQGRVAFLQEDGEGGGKEGRGAGGKGMGGGGRDVEKQV